MKFRIIETLDRKHNKTFHIEYKRFLFWFKLTTICFGIRRSYLCSTEYCTIYKCYFSFYTEQEALDHIEDYKNFHKIKYKGNTIIQIYDPHDIDKFGNMRKYFAAYSYDKSTRNISWYHCDSDLDNLKELLDS